VDLENETLAWRARWDKLGREWRQPLRLEARAALMVCLAWREKAKYHGPWVFFSEDERRTKHDHEPVYGHQALAYALQKAEKAAGVPHLVLGAMHGLRRMVVGEIIKLTGDIVAAAHFIGDKDLRVVNKSYTKRRDDQLRDVAVRLDQTRKVNEIATEEEAGIAKLVDAREPLVGFEPTTARLRIESSTPELQWRDVGCPGADSNRDAFRHYPLKIACLPVSPPGRNGAAR
jgi:hypothetical protein